MHLSHIERRRLSLVHSSLLFTRLSCSHRPPPTAVRTSTDFHFVEFKVEREEMAGQSNHELSLFSAEELEFIAEDEIVDIVPNLKMDPLCLISGDFGPFTPQIVTQVPLWLAIALKKRGKCSIVPPQWMSVEKLTQVLEAERDSQEMSEHLPFHYVEISRLLFDHARDNITDAYMVRSLVEDIRDVRFHKVETDLEAFNGRTIAVKIKNLSAMEVNIVRPFIGRALQAFYKHDSPDLIPDPERVSDRRPQVAPNAPRRQLRR